MLWSMKKGLPLGALRTSQPFGRKPDSNWGSGLCGRDSWGGGGGAAAAAAAGAVAATGTSERVCQMTTANQDD